jgi:hypothetical protein
VRVVTVLCLGYLVCSFKARWRKVGCDGQPGGLRKLVLVSYHMDGVVVASLSIREARG